MSTRQTHTLGIHGRPVLCDGKMIAACCMDMFDAQVEGFCLEPFTNPFTLGRATATPIRFEALTSMQQSFVGCCIGVAWRNGKPQWPWRTYCQECGAEGSDANYVNAWGTCDACC